MKEVERKIQHEGEKSLFDFVHLLRACMDSDAEYI